MTTPLHQRPVYCKVGYGYARHDEAREALSKPFNADKRAEMAAAMAGVNAAFGKPDGLQTRDEMLDEAHRYADLKQRLGHTFRSDADSPAFGHGYEKAALVDMWDGEPPIISYSVEGV